MNTIEKKVLLLPARSAIWGNSLYLTFSITAIPPDMDITMIFLHLPIPHVQPTDAEVREVKMNWAAKKIRAGYLPRCSKQLKSIPVSGNADELIFDVTMFNKIWRLRKKKNYGICVRIKNRVLTKTKINPYLIAFTI